MENFTDLVMPVAIGLIMFGIGLNLCFKDFKRVVTHPKPITLGLICQMVLLPLTALAIVYFWPMKPIYKVGVMLVAACPGGTASNLLAHMLKGRVALSVSLTAFNSFLILFTIPSIVELSYTIFMGKGQSVDLSFMKTFNQILFTVALPVVAGIFINEFSSKEFTEKLKKPLKYTLPLIMVAAFVIVIFFDDKGTDNNLLEKWYLLIPLILFNLSTILLGFILSRRAGVEHEDSFTIAIEMGLQNSALALFIASQLLKDKDVTQVAVFYGSFSFLLTWGVTYLLKIKSYKKLPFLNALLPEEDEEDQKEGKMQTSNS